MKLRFEGIFKTPLGEADVRAETLEATVELLTLHRDAIRVIEGTGPGEPGGFS